MTTANAFRVRTQITISKHPELRFFIRNADFALLKVPLKLNFQIHCHTEDYAGPYHVSQRRIFGRFEVESKTRYKRSCDENVKPQLPANVPDLQH